MSSPDVVVIGGGAAGIMAAWRAASLGARVRLIEKTSRLGTKILISGGGKCNVAHAGPIEDLLRAFRPNEARFLRPACYRFSNEQIMQMFTDRGLRIMTRADGRVFPIDQTAKDVVAILRDYLGEAGVEVSLETPVEAIEQMSGEISRVRLGDRVASHTGYRGGLTERGYGAKALLRDVLRETPDPAPLTNRETEIICRRVILAAGGSSYPNSGTTGDGYVWARDLGHQVPRIRAALAPIYLHLEEGPEIDRAGVAIRNCVLRARQNQKEIAKWPGDLLFTHQGISGPVALGISRVVAERQDDGEVRLEVDVVPGETMESLTHRLLAQTQSQPRRRIVSFVEELLPERAAEWIMADAGVSPDAIGASFDKKSRARLVSVLKAWSLGPVRAVPLEKGEVVAGGVSLDEVDPQTMRSKVVSGLYLCGEVLDVAGPVGGYNLQAAFATGYVAGETAARDALSM